MYQGFLVLVNPWHQLHRCGSMELVPADGDFPDILLQSAAAEALQEALREIGADGAIVPVSGYRTQEEQTAIFEGCLKEDGEEFTRKYVAVPGHSEHQIGLAIDLGLKMEQIDFIRPEFPYEGICQKFRETAPDFGFIERYPAGKEDITGTGHEPWHFRYVGFPHSRIITDKGFTLEEYMEYIRAYQKDCPLRYGKGMKTAEIYYVPAETADSAFAEVPEDAACQISGNNVDGYIVTLWRDTDGGR